MYLYTKDTSSSSWLNEENVQDDDAPCDEVKRRKAHDNTKAAKPETTGEAAVSCKYKAAIGKC